MKIDGASALVTGSDSGLGGASVAALQAAGAKVTGLDLGYGQGADENADLCIAADVTDEAAVDDSLDRAEAAHGPVRIVVNCAGVSEARMVLGRDGEVMPLDHFRRIVDVHMAGTFNICRLAANRMRALEPVNGDGERGVLITTASIAGIDGATGSASYAAAKAGVAGLTMPLAREFARYGIRVVCIAPGVFRTPMAEELDQEILGRMMKRIPFPNRLGEPEDFGALVKAICEISMFNGEVVRLDAGYRVSH